MTDNNEREDDAYYNFVTAFRREHKRFPRAEEAWQARAAAAPDESRELAYHPLVATEEMLNAARDWSLKKYGLGVGHAEANECWQVMYRAFNESRKR